jgi:hypothetical protein
MDLIFQDERVQVVMGNSLKLYANYLDGGLDSNSTGRRAVWPLLALYKMKISIECIRSSQKMMISISTETSSLLLLLAPLSA